MKNYTVKIKIEQLGGSTQISSHVIKAKTSNSAMSKAYQIIGDRTGEVLEIVEPIIKPIKQTNIVEKEEKLEDAALELERVRKQIKELENLEKGLGAEIRLLMEQLGSPSFEGEAITAQIVQRDRSSLDRGLLSQVLTSKQLDACTKTTHYFQLIVTKRS